METIYGIKALTRPLRCPVATMGMFDGVHLGHQKIIECVKYHAMKEKGMSIIITFDRHPKNLLENRPHSYITSLEHRLSLFERLGVDISIVLNFNQ